MPEMTPLEARLTKEVEALRRENKLLREKVDLLVRRIFGKSSEKMDADQLLLALEGAEAKKPEAASSAADALAADAAPKRPAKPRKKKGGLTEELLAALPAVEVVLVPDEVRAEPEAYRLVEVEVTKQLDYEPARYVCRKIIRKRFARMDAPQRPPVIAALPVMLERSKAGPGLLAAIITGKYCDHLPLYRQEQIARQRHRIPLPRQDMARWLGMAAEWLRPLYQTIRGGVWADGYAQIDETVIKYLEPGRGKAQHGYFWTVKRPGGDAVYHWSSSRAAEVLRGIIPVDFSGIVQCDGYTAYPAYAREHQQPLRLAACWAHARREFFEASQTGAYRADAGLIMGLIGHLYAVEARLRQRRAGVKLRVLARQVESRPILERIGGILQSWKKRGRHFPQSQMGKAVDYALTLWAGLSVFVEDGRVEIDNNEVENAIRPTAVGKKNWLFMGEARAGERGAILYTIVEACRRRQLDTFEYLRDVFTRMPGMEAKDYATLTPENWAKARAQVKPASQQPGAAQASDTARRCA